MSQLHFYLELSVLLLQHNCGQLSNVSSIFEVAVHIKMPLNYNITHFREWGKYWKSWQ